MTVESDVVLDLDVSVTFTGQVFQKSVQAVYSLHFLQCSPNPSVDPLCRVTSFGTEQTAALRQCSIEDPHTASELEVLQPS